MAAPPLLLAAIALAVVYFVSWYFWLPLFVALVVIRITMASKYQQMLQERLRLTKKRLEQTPSYNFAGSYPQLSADRQAFIVSLDASDLAHAIREKEISCREAMLAYIQQAQEAHRRTNCLTCHRFDMALREADGLDAMLAASGKPIGPLHGVPFSAKDNIDIAGLDSTIGLARLCNKPAKQDAVVIQLLRRAGAIPFVKTNVHQLMMGYECSNPVHGATSNPWNTSRVPGGSSGGESALLAQHGSAFGIGSDVGGSVRIPAHFCGVYALKPTSRQISSEGCLYAIPGQEAVSSSLGPMCRSVRDIDLVMSVIVAPEQRALDPEVIPTTFHSRATATDRHTDRKLRVGYYTNDGFFDPNPACVRAVTETVAALQGAGHVVAEFKVPNINDAMDTYFGLMVADGSRTQLEMMEGEVVDHTLKRLFKNRALPPIVVRLMALVFARVFKWQRIARALLVALPKTVQETWDLQHRRRLYRKVFLSKMREQNLDCLICPVHVIPAVLHGTSQRILALVSYTGLYNLIDFPAGVVPSVMTTPSDVATRGTDMWDQDVSKNEVAAAGMPIGVQVICAPFEEELCVDVMSLIERLRPFAHTPPCLSSAQESK